MEQRKIALDIIQKTMSERSFTNLLMRNKLRSLPLIQRPFVTNLVNSVLKNFDLLLYQVKGEIDEKTSLRNRIILAMALYERFFMDEKEYAVNNEYVELAGNKYDKSFINAILRKERQFKYSSDPCIDNSLSKWLYDLLSRQYDEKQLKMILANYKRTPKVYYRINHRKARMEDLEDIEVINEDIFISKNNLINTAYLKEGLIYVQDINSASLYKHLDLKEDDVLLDVCSAPGSKLFNCLDVIKPYNAHANDIYEQRLKLIKDKAEVLGYAGINYYCMDGCFLKDVIDIRFDKIMLDAPCSGLGTLGRKPDLKYHMEPSSLDELERIQRDLLDGAKELLKEGGILLYSTCTLNKKENRRQIDAFLKRNTGFKLLEDDTIINEDGDCFYYAKLLKGYNE